MDNNNWLESIEKEISSLKDKIGKKDYQEYKLDYLQRVAQKVALFSLNCTECHGNQQNILRMVSNVMDSSQMTAGQMEDYFNTFRSVINHLEGHIAKPINLSRIMLIIGSLILLTSIIFVCIIFSLENDPSNLNTGLTLYILAGPLFIIGLIILVVGFFIRKGEK